MSKAIECIRLFSTMIDGGEKHSKQSREIESQALAELAKPEPEDENQKYTKPCPYDNSVPCVQYPTSDCDDIACDECEVKLKAKQPEPCKTCGGSGRKKWTVTKDWPHKYTLCPQCKGTGIEPACQKPEQTEFTKECRELIKTENDDKGWTRLSGYVVWLETELIIACGKLDTQQAKIEWLKGQVDYWQRAFKERGGIIVDKSKTLKESQ